MATKRQIELNKLAQEKYGLDFGPACVMLYTQKTRGIIGISRIFGCSDCTVRKFIPDSVLKTKGRVPVVIAREVYESDLSAQELMSKYNLSRTCVYAIKKPTTAYINAVKNTPKYRRFLESGKRERYAKTPELLDEDSVFVQPKKYKPGVNICLKCLKSFNAWDKVLNRICITCDTTNRNDSGIDFFTVHR